MRIVDALLTSRVGSLLRTVAAATLALSLGGLAGCGGSGHGFSVNGASIVIHSANLAPTLSGQVVNIPIDFSSTGGGAYLIEVIDGAPPPGITFNNATVSMQGRIVTDGTYRFTIKLTDTGLRPFLTTTQEYVWVVGKGPLVFATDANLPSYIFNRFDVINLVLAGGKAPVECELIDDPLNLFDGLFPNGLSIPDDSCSIVGAPVGVLPFAPFIYKVSIKATDSTVPVPLTVVKEFTITVLVPDVVITTASVPNGICGQSYTSKVNIVDGIAPFLFTVVDAPASNAKLLGEPGTPGGVAKAAALSAYDLDTSNGSGSAVAPSYSGRFPEGLYMRESSGDILGISRRRGTFANWNFHVQSAVLPLLATQNKWKQFTFAMADSVPPNVALDNSVLLTGNVFGAPGNNFFQGPSKGVSYSKQFLATGGCPQDAKFDGPHEAQAIANPGEVIGRYSFAGTVFDLQTGNLITIGADPTKVPAGTTFSTSGLFSGIATVGSTFQTVTVRAEDSQLPQPRSAAHIASGTAQFEIGPDNVVITETTTGASNVTFDNAYDMNSQTVEMLVPSATGALVRALVAGDMVNSRTHPVAGGTLAGSLTNIDFMRVSVNPTWWAYDGYNLNARGARTMQRADGERRNAANAFGSDVSYAAYEGTPSLHNQSREHASNPAIEIPATVSASPITVTASAANGIYTNGGLLYAYDNPSAGEFGFFIVRKDSRIDIPIAFSKAASGFAGFGDAVITSNAAGFTSMFRIPQITVSPDGRMAAVKLKQSVDIFNETATNQRIALFSLTGEKMFGGSTFTTITPGGARDTTDGQYLYGSSLTLTNYGLFALRGNNIGTVATNGDRVIYAEHWVWKAQIFNPATTYDSATLTYPNYLTPTTMALLALTGGSNNGNWVNTATNPVSCCFQRWSSPGSTLSLFAYGNAIPSVNANVGVSPSATQSQPYEAPTSSFISSGQMNGAGSLVSTSSDFWHFSYANFGDNSAAPHPFRVSQNGRACVIVGGANQSATVSTSTSVAGFLNRSVYVDYDNNFREAANQVRRFKSGRRTTGLSQGEPINRLYGWYDGPATQLEVSDDGTKIAVVYNASTVAWTTYMHLMMNNTDTREELAYYSGTAAAPDPWSSKTFTNVTNPSPAIFATNINWRIGCIAFTRNNAAFTFWAGAPLNSGNLYNYAYTDGSCLAGTMYAYTPGTNTLEGILPAAQGGHTDTFNTASSRVYTTGAPNAVVQAGATATAGCVKPYGSFYSNDGRFYWIECLSALDSSNNNGKRCIAVNVADTTTTINTRAPIRAFAPTWPAGKGFSIGNSYPYSYPGLNYYAGGTQNKVGSHVSNGGTNGLIFYAAYNMQFANTNKSNNYSYWQGGADALTTGWSHYHGSTDGAELFGLDTSLGGSPSQLSVLGANYRQIPYIQPGTQPGFNGGRVAFQASIVGTGNMYEPLPGNETLRVVSGIVVSATGSLSASSAVVLEATNGRMGPSLALDSTGTKVYYGFSTSGNENGMVLKEVTLNSAGTAIQGTPRTFNGVGGTPARFAVLWSGR